MSNVPSIRSATVDADPGGAADAISPDGDDVIADANGVEVSAGGSAEGPAVPAALPHAATSPLKAAPRTILRPRLGPLLMTVTTFDSNATPDGQSTLPREGSFVLGMLARPEGFEPPTY